MISILGGKGITYFFSILFKNIIVCFLLGTRVKLLLFLKNSG